MKIIRLFFQSTILLSVLIACNTKIQHDESVAEKDSIDREALVKRHMVHLTSVDTMASLSVGNGDFAFTVDASGLQSFYQDYENGVSLGTQSQWGWHSIPSEEKYTLADVAVYDTSCTGQVIPFPVQHSEGRRGRATHDLRTNPHRLHLGIVGFEFTKSDGEKAILEDLEQIDQTLNPWTGEIESNYTVEGVSVKVVLYGNQQEDAIAAKVTSPLIEEGRLKVFLKFPYGSDCHVCPGYDWDSPNKHQTTLEKGGENSGLLKRVLDSTTYYTQVHWSGKGEFHEQAKHYWLLTPGNNDDSFDFSVTFSPQQEVESTDFSLTRKSSEKSWEAFWKSGAAVDFSHCTDPRANELERRVVLSQYLTKIQCAGSLPPQETGLTMNSWYGKFHLEMHWWHGVHFALWDRLPLLEKSLGWYDKIMNKAKHTAKGQGYEGVRWPKMTDPYGDESPSGVGTYLVWQQPHFIYFSELVYRQKPNKETLQLYKDRVFATADFMASFVNYNTEDGYYHMCPPLKPAQELFPAKETLDPPFELTYWHYALSVAQLWRERLGLPKEEKWQEVIEKLAPLAIKDSLYLPTAAHTNAYKDDFYRRDHPVVLGALGMLPASERVDSAIMANTYEEIKKNWQWKTTWGWDYPMMAMTAARLGHPKEAVDALLVDLQKNTYLPNGHNYQDDRLRIYLPGNGGLLTAVAMMAVGWDGAQRDNPGFPHDGTWDVRWEGLHKMP